MGLYVWLLCLYPDSWSLYCQKLFAFCKFFVDVDKNSKAAIAIYLALLKSDIDYYAMT